MRSKVSKRFIDLLYALPKPARKRAYRAYRPFKRDPFHPGLQFKEVDSAESLYSVRIGMHYRALGVRNPNDVVTWTWIGSHAEYDKILRGK